MDYSSSFFHSFLPPSPSMSPLPSLLFRGRKQGAEEGSFESFGLFTLTERYCLLPDSAHSRPACIFSMAARVPPWMGFPLTVSRTHSGSNNVYYKLDKIFIFKRVTCTLKISNPLFKHLERLNEIFLQKIDKLRFNFSID